MLRSPSPSRLLLAAALALGGMLLAPSGAVANICRGIQAELAGLRSPRSDQAAAQRAAA
jgi:hypothetical protein